MDSTLRNRQLTVWCPITYVHIDKTTNTNGTKTVNTMTRPGKWVNINKTCLNCIHLDYIEETTNNVYCTPPHSKP